MISICQSELVVRSRPEMAIFKMQWDQNWTSFRIIQDIVAEKEKVWLMWLLEG